MAPVTPPDLYEGPNPLVFIVIAISSTVILLLTGYKYAPLVCRTIRVHLWNRKRARSRCVVDAPPPENITVVSTGPQAISLDLAEIGYGTTPFTFEEEFKSEFLSTDKEKPHSSAELTSLQTSPIEESTPRPRPISEADILDANIGPYDRLISSIAAETAPSSPSSPEPVVEVPEPVVEVPEPVVEAPVPAIELPELVVELSEPALPHSKSPHAPSVGSSLKHELPLPKLVLHGDDDDDTSMSYAPMPPPIVRKGSWGYDEEAPLQIVRRKMVDVVGTYIVNAAADDPLWPVPSSSASAAAAACMAEVNMGLGLFVESTDSDSCGDLEDGSSSTDTIVPSKTADDVSAPKSISEDDASAISAPEPAVGALSESINHQPLRVTFAERKPTLPETADELKSLAPASAIPRWKTFGSLRKIPATDKENAPQAATRLPRKRSFFL